MSNLLTYLVLALCLCQYVTEVELWRLSCIGWFGSFVLLLEQLDLSLYDKLSVSQFVTPELSNVMSLICVSLYDIFLLPRVLQRPYYVVC